MITNNALEERIDTKGKDCACPVVFHNGKNFRLLTMDRLVLEFSTCLLLAGARRVTSPVVEKRVYLLLDWEAMEEGFADFVRYGRQITVGGAALTVLGKVMPVAAHGNGCGVVSISLPGNRYCAVARQRENNGPLSALERAVRENNGTLRISEERGKTLLSVYLPVFTGGNETKERRQRVMNWNEGSQNESSLLTCVTSYGE